MRVGALAAFGVLTVMFLLLAASMAQAQLPGNPLEEEPPVLFEDDVIPGTVVPLGSPGQAVVPIGVGCDALETPDTETTATVQVATAPASAGITMSPADTSWTSEAGDCPSEGIVHEGETSVNVRFDETAAAFEPVRIQLEMMVEKMPPTGENPREYGPFVANITATPGYLERYEHGIDQGTVSGIAGEAVTFSGSLENLANGETRFELNVGQADGALQVDVEPAEIVLAPYAPGTFEVHVMHQEPEALAELSAYDVSIEITPSPTHPDGEAGEPLSLALVAEFEPLDKGMLGVPTVGPLVVSLTLCLLALLRRR